MNLLFVVVGLDLLLGLLMVAIHIYSWKVPSFGFIYRHLWMGTASIVSLVPAFILGLGFISAFGEIMAGVIVFWCVYIPILFSQKVDSGELTKIMDREEKRRMDAKQEWQLWVGLLFLIGGLFMMMMPPFLSIPISSFLLGILLIVIAILFLA